MDQFLLPRVLQRSHCSAQTQYLCLPEVSPLSGGWCHQFPAPLVCTLLMYLSLRYQLLQLWHLLSHLVFSFTLVTGVFLIIHTFRITRRKSLGSLLQPLRIPVNYSSHKCNDGLWQRSQIIPSHISQLRLILTFVTLAQGLGSSVPFLVSPAHVGEEGADFLGYTHIDIGLF